MKDTYSKYKNLDLEEQIDSSSPLPETEISDCEGSQSNWVQRLKTYHANQFILFLFLTSFIDGSSRMRSLALKLIYKDEFQLQPADSQKYMALTMVPTLFRMFIGVIIDSRAIIRERKYLVMGSHALMCLCFLAIIFGVADSAKTMCFWVFIFTFVNEFIMASLASYALQQGRKDFQYGQQDIQSLKFVGFGLAFATAAIIVAYVTSIGQPRIVFGISFFLSFMGVIQANYLSKDLETNEQATMKDKEVLLYEKEQQNMNPAQTVDGLAKPGCCKLFMIKMSLLKKGFQQKAIKKFFLFLVLQGLTMPSFTEFDYYWALDVLDISVATINLQLLFVSWLAVLVPIIYQKWLIKYDYSMMFVISQLVYVVAESINACLTLGYNKQVGIPNIVLYVLGGSVAQNFEIGFTFFISLVIVSKLTPPGIESTMYSLSVTFIVLNQFVLRAIMGIVINNNFIHVTKETMDRYIWLKVIGIITPFIPFLFMFKLLPTVKETNDLQKEYEQQKKELDEMMQQQQINQINFQLKDDQISKVESQVHDFTPAQIKV